MREQIGFSLVEVIIAMGLILVTVMIFGVALSALPLTKTARNSNIAYHVAAKKIEEIRNLPFGSLPASGSFTDSAMSQMPSGATASLTVQNYSGSSQIKQITATISWTENGNGKSTTLDTLVASGGLNQ